MGEIRNKALPKIIPTIPPSEVKMIECHSNLSFMKIIANEETPIPIISKKNQNMF